MNCVEVTAIFILTTPILEAQEYLDKWGSTVLWLGVCYSLNSSFKQDKQIKLLQMILNIIRLKKKLNYEVEHNFRFGQIHYLVHS